jgi:hypothetical protein
MSDEPAPFRVEIFIDADVLESEIVQELIRRETLKIDHGKRTITIASDELGSQIRVLLEIRMARRGQSPHLPTESRRGYM